MVKRHETETMDMRPDGVFGSVGTSFNECRTDHYCRRAGNYSASDHGQSA